jgi:hypothetical protein
MKFRLAASVMLVMVAAAFAAKIPNAQVVDSGSFGIFIGGKRVATETFKVEQRPDGSTVKSELKAQDGTTQRSDMELTALGEIVRYGWQQIEPSKAELSIVPKDEFLSETINAGPNQKAIILPHLMPHSTPILDDNFFLHREILLWRYLASECTPKPEGLNCGTAPQQFAVLIPVQHASESVVVDFKGKEKLPVKGTSIDCSVFRMRTDSSEWTVYMNNEQKVVRIAVAGLEVLRD